MIKYQKLEKICSFHNTQENFETIINVISPTLLKSCSEKVNSPILEPVATATALIFLSRKKNGPT